MVVEEEEEEPLLTLLKLVETIRLRQVLDHSVEEEED